MDTKSLIKHWSDCAVHNEPSFPNGQCDCGAEGFILDVPEHRTAEEFYKDMEIPAHVPSDMSTEDANQKFGERYGVDWIYI